MGLLTNQDSTLYRGFFKEMAYLRGIPVKYQYAHYMDPTIYAEMIPSYSEEIDMNIIFDENPRTATLKKINWVPNFPNDKPYIAYLPFDTPNLTVKAIISIPPIDSLHDKARRFEVTSITTLLEYPDAWVCTLAPIFNTDTPKTDYNKTNMNYVHEEVALDRKDPDKKNKNYNFLNIDE